MTSAPLDRSLVAYSLAGSASLLAVGSTDAAILYSGLLNHAVTFGNSYAMDIDGGGTDLTVNYVINGSAYEANVTGSAGAVVGANSGSVAWAFQSGDTIDSNVNKYGGSKMLAQYSGGVLTTGNFPANSTNFAGFRLGGTNYGWIRFAMGGPLDGTNSFTVVDWAYDNSGAAIQAGQTSGGGGGGVPLPGAAALAAFAVGATGLRGWRSRQRAA